MNEPTPRDSDPNAGEAYVSTGSLPSRDEVRALVETAHERFARETGGKIPDYIPALAEADPAHFGICVANARGESFAVGDADHAFSIQSVSKPFVFALVCDALGPDETERLLGVDATGQLFNSVMAVELRADHTTNPMVNSGAIATTSLVAGASAEDRWSRVRDGLSCASTIEVGARRRQACGTPCPFRGERLENAEGAALEGNRAGREIGQPEPCPLSPDLAIGGLPVRE